MRDHAPATRTCTRLALYKRISSVRDADEWCERGIYGGAGAGIVTGAVTEECGRLAPPGPGAMMARDSLELS